MILHGSHPVQEKVEGTNMAKQRADIETSRKAGERYNQEGARDGTRSDSHLVTNVWTNDRQASPRTKETQRESARSSPRGTAAVKATKKKTILTSERRGVERQGR